MGRTKKADAVMASYLNTLHWVIMLYHSIAQKAGQMRFRAVLMLSTIHDRLTALCRMIKQSHFRAYLKRMFMLYYFKMIFPVLSNISGLDS